MGKLDSFTSGVIIIEHTAIEEKNQSKKHKVSLYICREASKQKSVLFLSYTLST